MIFRRIEYWIEGPAHKQQAANAKAWTSEMYFRKGLKHAIYFAIAFIISNTFLSYIIGLKGLMKIIQEPVSEHLIGFLLLLLFTFLFYLVFAHVREIVCTVACPYGRLQGVLLDKNSIAVSYDYKRGEPRSKKRKTDGTAGDCIDCGMCVNVCPTGIDIRNGTQLECVNCTACIDACNMMMRKIGEPEDLIRYASENNIATGEKPKFTYRIKMYTGVLVILLCVLVALLITRSRFDATVLRVPGQVLQENADSTISNLYKIRIVNKSGYTEPYHIHVKEEFAKIEYVGKALDSLPSVTEKEETFFVKIPRQHIQQRKELIHIDVMSGDEIIQTKKISFIGEY
jgi:cytochrome c oxidase accessory protein FixG